MSSAGAELLLVDDSKVMREMIAACLRAEPGLAFSYAESGLEAIERLSLKPYDLVVLDLNQPDIGDFVAGFLAEPDDHLRAASKNLLALDEALGRGEPHPRAVRELFRSMHTIKGLSAMIGAEPIVDVAHAMESLLRAADRSP